MNEGSYRSLITSDLLRDSRIVTLRAPDLPRTRHLIGKEQITMMQEDATPISTARGALIDTGALIAELGTGGIEAVLDDTGPGPLPPDWPLPGPSNAGLTPHIAGVMGNEVPRLPERAIGETERLAAGLPLRQPVTAAGLSGVA